MAKPFRLAWFSPLPPVKTGIAGRSAELVDALRGRGHHIDTYPEPRAHDFPWRHRLDPYSLVVYQFGNSSHHDYAWAYALRYPGLVVLHDTHLHHARAAFLLREKRVDDYRAEFSRSHPAVSADAAEIAVAGFDSALYYRWPMVRSLVDASRVVAVHGEGARAELIEALSTSKSQTPNSLTPNSQISNSQKIVSVRLGEGELVSPEREARARLDVRAKYGIDQDAVLFGCFGGLTPEKRIAQILAALQATLPHAPNARLLLAGSPARHFDAHSAAAALGVAGQVTFTGYLESDDELTDHIAATDVSLNLRWPTARETSGPWLRALAAGKATVITDLIHLGDVASLDPRTWSVQAGTRDLGSGIGDEGSGLRDQESTRSPIPDPRSPFPICVAIDILDEDHSLRLAMRRLAVDADLRARLGRTAREYWAREHTVDRMADDYERVIAEASEAGENRPAHLGPDGAAKLRALLRPFGVPPPL